MFSLIPKEEVFFDLFESTARNVHAGSVQLLELLEKFDDREERVKRIKDVEHAGDQLTHDTLQRMNRTFITPIDRQDIHELVCRLDDILDLTDSAASRIVLYKIQEATPDAVALARCLRHATGLLVEAMPLLRNMKHSQALLDKCVAVHTQESEGDRLEQQAIVALFESGREAAYIIKWKDIYEDLEAATDRCEDVANVIEGIVLKNA